jgi:predicted TIM-barrel fold metal-dependent hydrolase
VRVIDADGHVLEPRVAFAHLPDDQRPRIDTDARGLDHVLIGNQEIFVGSLGMLGTPGAVVADLANAKPLEEAIAGAFDPHARLADLDVEGLDAVVLYPTVGLAYWAIADRDAALAVVRAYNDWLASFCAADSTRLFGVAALPFQDPQVAADELRRAHEELGFRVAFVRPNPCAGRTIVDPANEIVWETAEELDVAIGIHEGSQMAVPTLGLDRAPYNALVFHATSHAFEHMMACAQLMAMGVMERHPGLRFVFLEAGGGWAPYWIERLDHQVSRFGGYAPEMKLLPSEYFARQCWISFEVDEHTLPVLAPMIGADRIVWGTDYPHPDCTFPGMVKELRDAIAGLPESNQARILGQNAIDLYRLPVT